MAEKRQRKRLRWAIAAGAAAAAGALLALLFLPLPGPLLTALATRSSGWILTDYESDRALPVRAGRKLVGLTIQHGLADAFLEARPLPDGLSDAERAGLRLAALKPLLISQTELPHLPVNSPAALAGAHWCDGINGFAAIVLSHEFPRVEIVGLIDPERKAAHSFGRAWSPQRSEWLYFDVWAAKATVFRVESGKAQHLVRLPPLTERSTDDERQLARFYDRAATGFVHNRLQPTFGGYLVSRLWNLIEHGNRAPAGAAEAIAQAALSLPPQIDWDAPVNATPAPAAYVRARLAHILGDARAARSAYGEVVAAEQGGRSTYGLAARIFIARIDSGRF